MVGVPEVPVQAVKSLDSKPSVNSVPAQTSRLAARTNNKTETIAE